jgi:hypothetical protein
MGHLFLKSFQSPLSWHLFVLGVLQDLLPQQSTPSLPLLHQLFWILPPIPPSPHLHPPLQAVHSSAPLAVSASPHHPITITTLAVDQLNSYLPTILVAVYCLMAL